MPILQFGAISSLIQRERMKGMGNWRSKIGTQLQLILGFEWYSHHSIEKHIRQFAAISSLIQM
jgi:hypothetical protein